MNHPKLSQMISDKDLSVLSCLVDIRSSALSNREVSFLLRTPTCISEHLDVQGFEIEFEFSSNASFQNSILRKEYHVIRTSSGESMLERAIG